MTTRRSLRYAFSIGLLLALALPQIALGANGAPEVSLGRFEGIYLAIRPLATIAFVAMGLWAAMRRLWGTLTSMGNTPKNDNAGPYGSNAYDAPDERRGFGIGAILAPIAYIGLIVGVAVFILWFGIDMLNGAMRFVWEALYGGGGLPSPSTLPDPSALPDPSVTP